MGLGIAEINFGKGGFGKDLDLRGSFVI